VAAALTPFPEPSDAAVVGRRAVLEALRASRPVSRVLVARTADVRGALREVVQEARARGIVIQTVDRRHLDTLARRVAHQGVAALVAVVTPVTIEDLLEGIRDRGEAAFLVVLDGVQDPQNLGAIIRTADAAGAHGVIIPRRRAAGLSPAVARASAGAVAHLPVAQVGNLVAALERLKDAGVWIVGADPDGAERYDAAAIAPPVALVVGGESHGLHRLVRERCDRVVRIPLRGQVASLNVSVAAALLLYEVARRLGVPAETNPHRSSY
jgi:23S rRNA (guanosine2251-2'-O)-methyltransferase